MKKIKNFGTFLNEDLDEELYDKIDDLIDKVDTLTSKIEDKFDLEEDEELEDEELEDEELEDEELEDDLEDEELEDDLEDEELEESHKLKTFENFKKKNESVGEYENSFIDVNLDETELEDSDRPNLGTLKQKAGKIIIENPSKVEAYNSKMRLGGEVIQEPGFSDKQIHHVKNFDEF